MDKERGRNLLLCPTPFKVRFGMNYVPVDLVCTGTFGMGVETTPICSEYSKTNKPWPFLSVNFSFLIISE